MDILNKILPFALVLLLTGCYEDFTPDTDSRPVLCLNALVKAGEPITCEVSRTHLYSSVDECGDYSVADATVSIYVNGELKDDSYIASSGDRVRIVAESPMYGSAEAEVTVPEAVPVGDVKVDMEPVSLWKDDVPGYDMLASLSFNLKVEMEVDDPPLVENFYRLFFYYSYPSTEGEGDDGIWDASRPPLMNFNIGTFQYDAEPIFSEHIGVFESVMGGDAYGFTCFSDRQFEGRTYPLHLQFTGISYTVNSELFDEALMDCDMTVELISISRSYYNWANYLWHKDNGPLGDLSDSGLGEALCGYSNVSTGAGVVAAMAASSYKISFADFLKKEIFGE